MAQTMYVFNEEQFLEQTGKSLESYMSEDRIEPFKKEIAKAIYLLINQYGAISAYQEDAELSDWQLSQLIEAQIYQAQYVLENNVDPLSIFGINRYTETVIDMNQIKLRYWSVYAKLTLENAGFFYRGA